MSFWTDVKNGRGFLILENSLGTKYLECKGRGLCLFHEFLRYDLSPYFLIHLLHFSLKIFYKLLDHSFSFV